MSSKQRTRHGAGRLLTRTAAVSTATLLAVTALADPASAAPSETPTVEKASFAVSISGLSEGARGAAVTALQQSLVDAGITVPGGVDGVFGPGTRSAVIAFQNGRGLPATGIVDQATASALSSSGGAGGSSSSADGYVGLAPGARGALVTDVQRALMDLGAYVAGGADGVFGSGTERAVRQFQAWNQLGVTGTITLATAKRLGLVDGAGGTANPPAPEPAPEPDPAPAPTSDSPYVGLGVGDRGERVREVQQKLQATGLVLRGGADGVFGPATESALKAFQQFNRLAQTGVVGEREAELMGLGTSSTPAGSRYLGLKVGATGQLVKDVQRALMNAGVSVTGGADGVFGNATKSALTTYQTSVGVTSDGTVNQPTIDKLGLENGSSPVPFASSGGGGSDPAPPPSDNPYVGLRVGSSGERVRELQSALMDTGMFLPGGADGSFGAATERVLKLFQSVNGIPQTGVVTERGARLLALGSGVTPIAGARHSGGAFTLERFPVQGWCFFGDTWHAPRGGGRLHVGTDFIADEGKLLYAVADGEISKLYWDQPGALSGNGLRILTPNGTYFTYLHMLAFAPGIELGTKVKAGDVIGFVGNTGSSATAHLHFEIHPWGGAAINPYPYVKAIDDCKNTTAQYQSSFQPAGMTIGKSNSG